MNAQIGLAHNPSPPDPDDYTECQCAWLDDLDDAAFGRLAREFFDRPRNEGSFDAFCMQTRGVFDAVCEP